MTDDYIDKWLKYFSRRANMAQHSINHRTDKPTFYIDMDGVLVDLYGSSNALMRLDAQQNSIYRQAGTSSADFHKIKELIGIANRAGYNTEVLTAGSWGANPQQDASAAVIKEQWLIQHDLLSPDWRTRPNTHPSMLNGFNFISATRSKAEFAGRYNILLDDDAKNISAFKAAGGIGLQYDPLSLASMQQAQREKANLVALAQAPNITGFADAQKYAAFYNPKFNAPGLPDSLGVQVAQSVSSIQNLLRGRVDTSGRFPRFNLSKGDVYDVTASIDRLKTYANYFNSPTPLPIPSATPRQIPSLDQGLAYTGPLSSNKPITVIDSEFVPGTNEVLGLIASKYAQDDKGEWQRLDTFSRFFNPRDINNSAYRQSIAIHGLDPETLLALNKQTKPSEMSYSEEITGAQLADFMKDTLLVAHNGLNINDVYHDNTAASDWRMLFPKSNPNGLDTFDTVTAARNMGWKHNDLASLYKRVIGRTMEEDGLTHHNPLSDVIATQRIFAYFAKKSPKEMAAYNSAHTKPIHLVPTEKLGTLYDNPSQLALNFSGNPEKYYRNDREWGYVEPGEARRRDVEAGLKGIRRYGRNYVPKNLPPKGQIATYEDITGVNVSEGDTVTPIREFIEESSLGDEGDVPLGNSEEIDRLNITLDSVNKAINKLGPYLSFNRDTTKQMNTLLHGLSRRDVSEYFIKANIPEDQLVKELTAAGFSPDDLRLLSRDRSRYQNSHYRGQLQGRLATLAEKGMRASGEYSYIEGVLQNEEPLSYDKMADIWTEVGRIRRDKEAKDATLAGITKEANAAQNMIYAERRRRYIAGEDEFVGAIPTLDMYLRNPVTTTGEAEEVLRNIHRNDQELKKAAEFNTAWQKRYDKAYVRGDQATLDLLAKTPMTHQGLLDVDRQLYENEKKVTDARKQEVELLKAYATTYRAVRAAFSGPIASPYGFEVEGQRQLAAAYNTGGRAFGWLAPSQYRGYGFGVNAIQNALTMQHSGNMVKEGIIRDSLTGAGAVGTVGILTSGNPLAMIGTAVVQAGRIGWNAYQNYRTNQVTNLGETLQQTFNIMGLALEPLRMFGSLLGIGVRALRGFTNIVLRIPALLEPWMQSMSRLGNPYTSLTGVNYGAYQGTLAVDRMVGLGAGSTNASIEDFVTQQRSLYDSGEYNQGRLVAAARMGLFGLVYANGGNSRQQYASMVNQFASLIANNPTNAVFARQIDSTAAASAQALLALRTAPSAARFGIRTYQDMLDPNNVGVYFRGLSDSERNDFRVSQYRYYSAQSQLQNSGMRIANIAWNSGLDRVFNAINKFIDHIISNGTVASIIEKISTGIEKLMDTLANGLNGDWSDLQNLVGGTLSKIGQFLAQAIADWAPKIAEVLRPLAHFMVDIWGQIAKTVTHSLIDLWESLSDIAIDPSKIVGFLKGENSLGDIIVSKSQQAMGKGESAAFGVLQGERYLDYSNRRHPLYNRNGTKVTRIEDMLPDEKEAMLEGIFLGPHRVLQMNTNSFIPPKLTDKDLSLLSMFSLLAQDGVTPQEYLTMNTAAKKYGSDAFREALQSVTSIRTPEGDWVEIGNIFAHAHDLTDKAKEDIDKLMDEDITPMQHKAMDTFINDALKTLIDFAVTLKDVSSKPIKIDFTYNGKVLASTQGTLVNGQLMFDGKGAFEQLMQAGGNL